MLKRRLSYLALPLVLFLNNSAGDSPSRTAPNVPQVLNPGPDIITGDIGVAGGLAQFGSSGTQVGLGVSTTSCDAGNVPVDFILLPNTNHPVIPHNLYRMSGGPGDNERFEQIGQSWVKHAYGADQLDDCNLGCIPQDHAHLGAGCSDTYAVEQNANQNTLGSRALVNPFTGVFQSTASDHSGHVHTGTSHRILVEGSDLNTTLNPGASYYVEVQYISSQEYSWCQTHPGECNMYNNSSYRRFAVSGTTSFTFSPLGETVRMAPAVKAWTGASISTIEPAPGTDGRAFIAYKVTGPVSGVWHYEYAIYNENLDRGIQSFSLPLGCGIAVTNLGFHAPLNHPGFPNDGTVGDAGFSNAAWTPSQNGSEVSWSTETFAQNQNANAVRWGTLYNFRFDSDHAPVFTNATIGFFKTGTPVSVGILAPNACNVITTPSPTPVPTATPVPTPTPVVVPTPILPPGGNGKIAFVRNNNEIFTMDPSGANQTNLTNTQAQESSPAWSPDGTKIAFSSNRTGNFQIYVMNVNGSSPIRLVSASQGDDNPAWSPDGTKIAFSSNRAFNYDIYVMNANGSNQIRLTNDPAEDREPTWSPDGGKIAFTSRRDGGRRIYVMDADGSNQTSLTLGPDDSHPSWSPDGTKIAFTRSPGRIFVMSAYGTNMTGLTITGITSFSPAWSPDGTKIAFNKAEGENPLQFAVMDANGSNQIYITNDSNLRQLPAWQRIAPVATPTPPAAQAVNLSTRMHVQTGDNVGIGGFIITGTSPKRVLLRAIGPSLSQFGISNALADPTLELVNAGSVSVASNNNWRDTQETAIQGTGLAPVNDLEAAIDVTLDPGNYTAVLKGNGSATGVGLVEVYDLNPASSKLGNISTRAFAGTDNNIVIAGFILGSNSGSDRVIIRGIGPSLAASGVTSPLANPTLELRNSNGMPLAVNNDWQDNSAQAAELMAAGLAPTNNLEAGIAATLPPGLYTALLSGFNNGTGTGLLEVYDRGP
jgi:hypothetical protein